MILNNEHQYTSDERSLRYTEVEENDSITRDEVAIYKKWVLIIEDIITKKYWNFYRKFTKTDAGAKKVIHKLAIENARYLVMVFMKTTTTYTVPFIQINKVASYMQELINNPMDEYEKRLVPEMEEFIKKLDELDVILTKEKLYNLVTKEEYKDNVAATIKNLDSYKDNKELVYQNNKKVSLSIFADRNKYSDIESNSIFTHGILSYNNCESFACLAQEQRHRTIDCEMKIPQEQQIYVPEIIKNDLGLTSLWNENAKTVFDRYPQGMLVKVNRQASAKNILNFVAKERSCERAQLEIYKHYYEDIIPFMYDEALSNNEEEMARIIKPYVRKLKCQYPDYNCPTPCGHPRNTRDL